MLAFPNFCFQSVSRNGQRYISDRDYIAMCICIPISFMSRYAEDETKLASNSLDGQIESSFMEDRTNSLGVVRKQKSLVHVDPTQYPRCSYVVVEVYIYVFRVQRE